MAIMEVWLRLMLAFVVLGGLATWFFLIKPRYFKEKPKELTEKTPVIEKDEAQTSITESTEGISQSDTIQGGIQIAEDGKYPAYILDWGKRSLHSCRLNKACGRPLFFDPSMPKSGWYYLVKRLQGGELVDYEPRDEPLVSNETPSRAYFATHWDIVSEVFFFSYSMWHDMKTWLVAGLVVGTFIVVLATIAG